MNQSEQINELAAALSKAQRVALSASKDETNPFFKSRYSSLDSIWNAVREPLTSNNLSVVQSMSGEGDTLSLITTLLHSSGQWIRSSLPLMVTSKATPQALGSAITYMRRYSLAAIVGATSGDDDDANEAEKHVAKQIDERKEAKLPVEKVSLEEVEEIEANLDPKDSQYRMNLLRFFEVENFNQLPKEKFSKLMEALMKRKAKLGAAQ